MASQTTSLTLFQNPPSRPCCGLKSDTARRLTSVVIAVLVLVGIIVACLHLPAFNNIWTRVVGVLVLFYGIAILGNLFYACIGCCDKKSEEPKEDDLFYYTPSKAALQLAITVFWPLIIPIGAIALLIVVPVKACTEKRSQSL